MRGRRSKVCARLTSVVGEFVDGEKVDDRRSEIESDVSRAFVVVVMFIFR